MRYFFVFLENLTDRRDDMVLKVKAKSGSHAKSLADGNFNSYKFGIRRAYTRKQLKQAHPDWHETLWGSKAINE